METNNRFETNKIAFPNTVSYKRCHCSNRRRGCANTCTFCSVHVLGRTSFIWIWNFELTTLDFRDHFCTIWSLKLWMLKYTFVIIWPTAAPMKRYETTTLNVCQQRKRYSLDATVLPFLYWHKWLTTIKNVNLVSRPRILCPIPESLDASLCCEIAQM